MQRVAQLLTFVGILVAAIVATFGYLYTQASNDRERLARSFAEALADVNTFRFVPFQVRRRDATPDSRRELTKLVTKAQDRLDYHSVLLRLESPDVADAYIELVAVARREIDPKTKSAWESPPVSADRGLNMNLGVEYASPSTESAMETCIAIMRERVGRRSWWRRRRR